MYCPKLFQQHRPDALHNLIQTHSLGAWTCWADNQLIVNHIPFLLDPDTGSHGVLHGHVARANPVWQKINSSTPSVVCFQGSQAYISPSWYASKEVHGKVVPTWNYTAVHIHGEPKVIDTEEWLRSHAEQLSNFNEKNRDTPWQVTDAPASYIEKMLRGIVGIEITIQTIEGRWKVSQNKNAEDKRGIEQGLSKLTDSNTKNMAHLVAGTNSTGVSE